MNTKKTMKNMFRKITTAGLALLSAISIMPASVSASADYTYMIAPLMDVKNHKLQTYVVQDSSSGKEKYFTENSIYLYEDAKMTDIPVVLPTSINYKGSDAAAGVGYSLIDAIPGTDTFLSNHSTPKSHYLVFPGADGGKAKTSTEYDYQQATYVANTLSTSLNSAISFIVDEGHYDMTKYSDVDGFATFLCNLGRGNIDGFTFKYDLSGESAQIFRDDGVTVKTDDEQMGNSQGNYVKITNNTTGESRIFQYRVPKGYAEDQYLSNVIKSSYPDDDYGNDYKISKYISWQGLTFYSIVAAGARGYTANDQGEKSNV